MNMPTSEKLNYGLCSKEALMNMPTSEKLNYGLC